MSILQRHAAWHQGRGLRCSPAAQPICYKTHTDSGTAALHLEERLRVALQRSFIQLVQSRTRAIEAGRILENLALLKIFRGGGRGALAELVVTRLHTLLRGHAVCVS